MSEHQISCEAALLSGAWDRAAEAALAWARHPEPGGRRDPRPHFVLNVVQLLNGRFAEAWTSHALSLQEADDIAQVKTWLEAHPRVRRVCYPGGASMGAEQVWVYRRQCTGPGSVLSFLLDGGEAEAFAFLDRLRVVKLAVSLGGIESLIEHPASMTHADMTAEEIYLAASRAAHELAVLRNGRAVRVALTPT